MHLASFFPSLSDWGGIISFVWNNPGLLIQQTTVSTGLLAVFTIALQVPARRYPPLGQVLRVIAPPMVVVSLAIAVGSQILATEVLVRFHRDIPDVTETQFTSGVLHLLIFGVAAWMLRGWWRKANPPERAKSRLLAGTYLAAQLKFFEPPWISFQGQRETVLWIAWICLIGLTTWAILDLLRDRWLDETERAFRLAR